MIDEWGGTLTLAEASSRELMRVLKEQDDEFMDNLFNGKCGFTLKCTDGRSVELVPKEDRKTENCSEIPTSSEPQTCPFSDCDNFKNPDYARCVECKRKQIEPKTEVTIDCRQTERE